MLPSLTPNWLREIKLLLMKHLERTWGQSNNFYLKSSFFIIRKWHQPKIPKIYVKTTISILFMLIRRYDVTFVQTSSKHYFETSSFHEKWSKTSQNFVESYFSNKLTNKNMQKTGVECCVHLQDDVTYVKFKSL